MNPVIDPCPVPPGSLLARYSPEISGGYVDALRIELPGEVSLESFVAAFYSSRIIRLELFVLGLLFRKPWSGKMARSLAATEAEAFSAWRVEARTSTELLMREIISGKTRSWLSIEPRPSTTCLYFGSAVLPVGLKPDGSPRMSALFALLPFHRIYARLLLRSAAARLLHASREAASAAV